MQAQFYNLETNDGKTTKVLVTQSLQHDPYERFLTVSKSAIKRLAGDVWYCASPTPHRPKATLVQSTTVY